MKNMAEVFKSVVDKVEWGSVLRVSGIERVCDVFKVCDGGEDEM